MPNDFGATIKGIPPWRVPLLRTTDSSVAGSGASPVIVTAAVVVAGDTAAAAVAFAATAATGGGSILGVAGLETVTREADGDFWCSA